MLPNGLMVDATANGVDMDTLKSAVNSMDMAALGALTREK